MKILKNLSKRGLALFLVLAMCMSLLPTTAMAAELADDETIPVVDEIEVPGETSDDPVTDEIPDPALEEGDTDGDAAEPVVDDMTDDADVTDEEDAEPSEDDEDRPALATYVFIANGKVISTQVLKDGDELQIPAVPSTQNQMFLGWDREVTAGPVTVVKTETIEVVAQYRTVYHVYFADKSGTVYYTAEVLEGMPLMPVDVDAATAAYEANGLAADETLVEWDGLPADKVRSDVTVTAITAKAEFAIFDANGGKLSGSGKAKIENGAVTAPADPTRLGYTFAGWYTAAEGGSAADFRNVAAGTVFYAHWNPGTASYTVQYWIENADDAGYSYAGSETIPNGTVGSSATAAGDVNKLNNLLSGDDKGQFTFNSSKTAEENAGLTIEPDGSTLFNLYFTR
ncbi:MAG: hypothetical protein HDT18_07595, partial [Oscillibacter sp.]|nr:hypothetical protein [Oscillibacter sp.]